MAKIIFLLEERSMKILLDGLLPRLFPGINFLCVPHEGKQDLEKSIPRKLKAWREPGVRFVIVRDNDNADCEELKAALLELCRNGGRADSLVRLACQELEAWYFGEPESLANAYARQDLAAIGQRARYRDPDTIQTPSAELSRLIPEFQKISGARRMSEILQGTNNSSRSFTVFCRGIRALLASQ
ncbi:MAG: DUF4276 family protein [Acidobacteriota bacterium]|nr:DUF4276 family protein [Acidobacteriota bacterium]